MQPIKVVYYPDGRKLRLDGGYYTNLSVLKDYIRQGHRLSVRAHPEYTYFNKNWELEILKKILVKDLKEELSKLSPDDLYGRLSQ